MAARKIAALPAHAAYVDRRKHKAKSDKDWRWKVKKPAGKQDVDEAERQLEAKLPKDCRKFLTTYGETELLDRLPGHSGELRFYKPAELATQRATAMLSFLGVYLD